LPADPRHAPVPADQCGDPLACPELLPAGAEYDCELTIPYEYRQRWKDLLDELFASLGLPTGRLVIRGGLRLFTADGGGQTWLAVDYVVPGVRGEDGRWGVELNSEAGRAEPGDAGAQEPALDRWVAELDGPLPAWLVSADTDPVYQAQVALADARARAADAQAEHARAVDEAAQRLREAIRAAGQDPDA
jgi:hypothetical protein